MLELCKPLSHSDMLELFTEAHSEITAEPHSFIVHTTITAESPACASEPVGLCKVASELLWHACAA